MTLHDRRWRPSWKLAAILKGSEVWIVFITLCEHFSCSKIQFIIRMILFNHLLPYIKYKIAFHDSPCRPYWKRRSYCNFVWSAFFSWRAIPIEYLCQICCLYHNLILLTYAIICFNKVCVWMYMGGYFVLFVYSNCFTKIWIIFIYETIFHNWNLNKSGIVY